LRSDPADLAAADVAAADLLHAPGVGPAEDVQDEDGAPG
jgi:hypothetical protein